MFGFGILSGLIAMPLLGVAVHPGACRATTRRRWRNARWAALIDSTVTFVLSLVAWGRFDTGDRSTSSSSKASNWLGGGLGYKLGVDGISMPFVLLTTFLMPFCIASAWRGDPRPGQGVPDRFLVLEAALIGVFSALDVVLFYLFFEGGLIPMFLIIGIWGGKRRIYASMKFFLYTLLGSLLMLLAIMKMYGVAGTTDITVLLHTRFPVSMQYWLWLAFFASFAVKMPMWPVHTWLPDAHVEAPTAGSVVLAGILLKLGGYGFLRFSLPMFPDASHYFAPLVFALSVIAIVYTSLVALVQDGHEEADRLFVGGPYGLRHDGALHPDYAGHPGRHFPDDLATASCRARCSSASAWSTTGCTRARSRPTAASSKRMPKYAVVMLFFTMANIGLPGTSGFVGEFLTMLGAFQVNTWVALFATLGTILSAGYALYLYRRVVFGKLEKASLRSILDLNAREIAILAPLVILTLYYGVHPQPILDASQATVDGMMKTLTAAAPHAAPIKAAAAVLAP